MSDHEFRLKPSSLNIYVVRLIALSVFAMAISLVMVIGPDYFIKRDFRVMDSSFPYIAGFIMSLMAIALFQEVASRKKTIDNLRVNFSGTHIALSGLAGDSVVSIPFSEIEEINL